MKKTILTFMAIIFTVSMMSSCFYSRKTGCPSQATHTTKSAQTIG